MLDAAERRSMTTICKQVHTESSVTRPSQRAQSPVTGVRAVRPGGRTVARDREHERGHRDPAEPSSRREARAAAHRPRAAHRRAERRARAPRAALAMVALELPAVRRRALRRRLRLAAGGAGHRAAAGRAARPRHAGAAAGGAPHDGSGPGLGRGRRRAGAAPAACGCRSRGGPRLGRARSPRRTWCSSPALAVDTAGYRLGRAAATTTGRCGGSRAGRLVLALVHDEEVLDDRVAVPARAARRRRCTASSPRRRWMFFRDSPVSAPAGR